MQHLGVDGKVHNFCCYKWTIKLGMEDGLESGEVFVLDFVMHGRASWSLWCEKNGEMLQNNGEVMRGIRFLPSTI